MRARLSAIEYRQSVPGGGEVLRFRARRCRQLLICGVLTSVCLRVGAAEAPVATPVVPTGQRTTVVAAPPADDFIFVTGAGYEGAIVPASSPWSRMAEVTSDGNRCQASQSRHGRPRLPMLRWPSAS